MMQTEAGDKGGSQTMLESSNLAHQQPGELRNRPDLEKAASNKYFSSIR
jgi:hypothetical protein